MLRAAKLTPRGPITRSASPLAVLAGALTSLSDCGASSRLDAYRQVDRQTRRVRSTHVLTPGAGLVLDEYAPPGMFHAVCSPPGRSVHVLPAPAA